MYSVGNMEQFYENNYDFESYIERFDLYVKCNNIVDAKIVPTLH